MTNNYNTQPIEKELDWNDTIENDSADFILLPAGEYEFTVKSFERARHPGSEKLPACNKAVLSLEITNPEGPVTLKHNLFLHTKVEGLLCAFFTCIGQRKHGEKLSMDWNKVIGAKGRCEIYVDKWKNDKGVEMSSNKIKKFIEPKENASPTSTYTPGAF